MNILTIVLASVILQASAPQPVPVPVPVPDVRKLTVSAPKILSEIDTTKVQGNPVGLAWNADGTIYLRVTQGKDKTRHYQIATVPALSVGQSDQIPAWAATYWSWKSATTAPDDPSLKIDVEQRRERTKSVNTSSGGSLAGMSSAVLTSSSGGEGMSETVAAAAANSAVMSDIVTMRFKGQVVAEWINELPQPGMRFGWAPAPMGVLACIDAESRLALLDRDGHKVLVPGASHALLPAWSLDGTRIVYLQKKSQTLYLLMIASVR